MSRIRPSTGLRAAVERDLQVTIRWRTILAAIAAAIVLYAVVVTTLAMLADYQ